MVNVERLAETFRSLASTGSVSRREAMLAGDLRRRLEVLGAEVGIDDTAAKTGSDTGNLIARLKGTCLVPALLLNAHMDTVQPGEGVTVQFVDGVFTSDGRTILGADDKSAIAVISKPCACSKRGIGARPARDRSDRVRRDGLAVLRTWTFTVCGPFSVTPWTGRTPRGSSSRRRLPTRFEIRIIGKDAHAGAHPEKGINAIHLAAKAMAGLTLGRIDHENHCNIGWIEGGAPPTSFRAGDPQGGSQSHDEDKLERVTADI